MNIVIGLGNPEEKHKKTRHNLGFIFIDFLREKWEFPKFEENSKFKSLISKKEDLLLVKPETFMNLSGEAIKNILDFYKLNSKNITVIHDDIDIKAGKYKIADDSSSAGHNGIKDIINKLGTQKFRRIRIGVKNEKLRNPINPTDFVLQNFEDEELEKIQKIFPEIEKEIG